MTFERLASLLRSRLDAAGNKTYPTIHLFGIEFADEPKGHSLSALAEAAGISKNYGTELSKGWRIAPFVSLKKQ